MLERKGIVSCRSSPGLCSLLSHSHVKFLNSYLEAPSCLPSFILVLILLPASFPHLTCSKHISCYPNNNILMLITSYIQLSTPVVKLIHLLPLYLEECLTVFQSLLRFYICCPFAGKISWRRA